MGAMTPEQKAANEALSAAVEGALSAFGYQTESSVTVGFLVVVEQRIFDGLDEDGSTGLCKLYKDNHMSWVSALGLLRAATLKTEADYLSDD